MATQSSNKEKQETATATLPANCIMRSVDSGVHAEYNFTPTRSESKLCDNEEQAKKWLADMVAANG